MIGAPEGCPTWVEVRAEALRANLANVRAHAGVPVCAVVKANGYGHGLVEAARILSQAGAAMLGVTRIDEAEALRAAGIQTPILILAPGADPSRAVAARAELAIGDDARIETLPSGVRAHLEIDLGMGRSGAHPERARDLARALAARGLLAGVMTHLPDAAAASGAGRAKRFARIVGELREDGLSFVAHLANSAGLLAIPEARFDLVRVGTLLYGQHPPGATPPWEHRPGFAWYARVASVRTLRSGEPVGYGSEYVARRPTRIATLPIGWADGFGTIVQARTPEVRERVARLRRAVRPDDRHVLGVASRDGVPLSAPIRLPVIGRIGMQAVTVADPTASMEEGSICSIPGRRITVSPAIPRIVV